MLLLHVHGPVMSLSCHYHTCCLLCHCWGCCLSSCSHVHAPVTLSLCIPLVLPPWSVSMGTCIWAGVHGRDCMGGDAPCWGMGPAHKSVSTKKENNNLPSYVSIASHLLLSCFIYTWSIEPTHKAFSTKK